jgi:hypothetical protein
MPHRRLAHRLRRDGPVEVGGQARHARYPLCTFFVADVHRRICRPDSERLADVFAPRNPAEFGRILEPGGFASS